MTGQVISERVIHNPTFPRLLAKPLWLVPDFVHAAFLTQALNHIVLHLVEEEELSFLIDRHLCFYVDDLNVSYYIQYDGEQFLSDHHHKEYDVKISGHLYDFLLLMSRQEDSDTLFFNRRLRIEGGTEIGLQLKNLFDAVDLDELPDYMKSLIKNSVTWYEKIF